MKHTNNIPKHNATFINGVAFFPLKKQYRGVLNEKQLPSYIANTWLMQSTSGIVHFHYALN
jgi:hypothetical protein